MKNGVYKCVIRYDAYTIELVKTEKQGTDSTLLLHLDKKYCFDWCKEIINQYNLAIHYARLAAVQFRLEISETGYLVKRPHIAFEEDLIALFIEHLILQRLRLEKQTKDRSAELGLIEAMGLENLKQTIQITPIFIS